MTLQHNERYDHSREKNLVPIGDPFRAESEDLIIPLQDVEEFASVVVELGQSLL